MSDQSYSLHEISKLTACQLIGDPAHQINDVADIKQALAHQASFLANVRYQAFLNQSEAGVIFVGENIPLIEGKNYLISKNPSKSFQQFIDLLFPQEPLSGFNDCIHPSAVIHPSASIGINVHIGPHVVVDSKVIIGANSWIGAGTVIGPKTTIGEGVIIHPRVTIRENCRIGDRVILQPGAVIGSCGFGYITENGQHLKLNQVGRVIIEDDVEIGANTTIDRGRFGSTVIGKGSKIDNLVQIAHGVKVGAHNMIVAQTGIAGSTTTGRYVVLAGQVAIAGHLHIGDMVTVAGKSGVSKSLTAGKYGGIPAIKIDDYNRNQVLLRNIEKYVQKLNSLQIKIQQLEHNTLGQR